MRVHILGAGTPTPTAERFGSAYVIDTGDGLVMFDCGPAATQKLVRAGLWPTDIDHLFFTHHHFDHDVDYPCFLLCRWDQSVGKENELQVYGPNLTRRLTDRLIGPDGAFTHDIEARIGLPGSQQVFVNRGGTLPRRPPVVHAHDVDPGYVKETDGWLVRASYADHAQPFLDSLAWRLETASGSVVITGDTAPCDSVRDLARGADVMLCMCWDHQECMEESGESRGQCGSLGAGRMAEEAGVKNLVLVHTGPNISRPAEQERAVDDVKKIYSGDVWFSTEVMSLDF